MVYFLKKIRDISQLFFLISIYKILKKKNWVREISYNKIISKNISIKYISNKLKTIFDFKKKIANYYVDSTLVKTKLCEIGKEVQTDKSPYNSKLHRHPYTPVYNLIFSNIKHKNINFAEIGILNNKSIQMWRRFFPNSTIYAFEFDEKLIRNAKKDRLEKVIYKNINVKDTFSIKNAFSNIQEKFDVIIDDSTHAFEDQINIIKNVMPYLKTDGILVIEDIPKYKKEFSEANFYKYLKYELEFFHFYAFIDCDHINKFSKGWDNDRLLILTKK